MFAHNVFLFDFMMLVLEISEGKYRFTSVRTRSARLAVGTIKNS
jgi:hypothetical protein